MGNTGALCQTDVLRRFEQRKEGKIKDRAVACKDGVWKTKIDRTL